MEKTKLRVGVVGLGFMGELHARVWSQLPNADLVAVADLNPETGKPIADELGCAFHADPGELLARNDIDAVSIVTPDRAHVDPAVAAAAAGKHILLEKPMAHTAAAAGEIADAAKTHGVRLMVAHVLRFDPRYVQLQQAADPDKLGDVIHIRAKRNSIRDLASRLGANSSILFYLGVHDVDMMQWVARSAITRVYAQKVQKLSNGNEDALYAVVNFANGAIGTLDYSWAWPSGLPAGYYAGFEVVGTKNAALLDVRDQGLQIIGSEGPTNLDTHLWPTINGKITGDLRDELLHFAEAILAGEPFVQDPEEARDAIRVLDAIFTSIETGAPADVIR
ncbi:MAG: Gfo/Idh/MocA family oxidoreductase [Pseudomonadota bacterium]